MNPTPTALLLQPPQSSAANNRFPSERVVANSVQRGDLACGRIGSVAGILDDFKNCPSSNDTLSSSVRGLRPSHAVTSSETMRPSCLRYC